MTSKGTNAEMTCIHEESGFLTIVVLFFYLPRRARWRARTSSSQAPLRKRWPQYVRCRSSRVTAEALAVEPAT